MLFPNLPAVVSPAVPERQCSRGTQGRDRYAPGYASALPYADRLQRRCGRGCEKRHCGCRAAWDCGYYAGRGSGREGTRRPGTYRTLS